MRILIVLGLLLAAHLNLTALVPAAADQAPPPWWVGGRLVWPFGLDTNTLVQGSALDTLTPLLGIASAVCFVLAAGAVLGWVIPTQWAVACWSPVRPAPWCCRWCGSPRGPCCRSSWTACCSGRRWLRR